MTEETKTTTAENHLQTMLREIKENAAPQFLNLDDAAPDQAHLITLPKDRVIQSVGAEVRAAVEYFKPFRRAGTAQLRDLQSLIDWANRFKGDTSALFAQNDMAAPSLTVISDYHAAGPVTVDDPDGDPTARHCHHRAIYNFPLSDEWKAWMKVSETPLEKDDMGEFIEARAKDIMDPTPAVLSGKADAKNEDWENRLIETAQKIEGRYGQLHQLLAMSRQFQIYETSNLNLKTNRETGEQEIQFLNEHKTPDGKPLNVPNLIIIAIPVFLGAAPYRMAVRFRYRKTGGTVKFILSLYNPERVFESAFSEAVNHAALETGLPLFLGSPEG
jgi:hypothetical protein